MEELTRLRADRGWSQQRLADEADVDKATVNQIERGRRSPNVETLEKLADALGVGVADFFPKVQAPLPFEDDQRRSAEELGRAWAQHVTQMQAHREDMLERRLDDATSEKDRLRASSEFQAAYLHVFVLIEEARRRFPAVSVEELRAAMEAWRRRLLEFYAGPDRRVSPAELEKLEAQMIESRT